MPLPRSRLAPVVDALAAAEADCVALGLDALAANLSTLGIEAATLQLRDDRGEQYDPKRSNNLDDVIRH